MIRRLAAVALAGGALCPASAVAQQQTSSAVTPDPVMLVVDTSGSMSDDDEGGARKKIDGAKLALLDFIDEVEAGTPVGLRAYPAIAGGCDEGSVLQPVGSIDPRRLSATVRGLVPDGDTPTAEALRAAATDLGSSHGTLVLVSDGESTCDDPCEAAKEIAQRGVDFEAITVGFRISDEGRDELRCIAEAFDGRYVAAQNGEELAEAVAEAGRTALSVTVDTPTIEAVADTPVRITATVSNTGDVEARDVVARLRAVDVGSNPGVRRPVQRLGNLEGRSAARTVSWTFRPGSASLARGSQRRVAFKISADAANGNVPVEQNVVVVVGDLDSATSAGPILKGKRVAIVGDSYSAGEGADDYFPETRTSRNGCHRSRSTYLMRTFSLGDDRLLACSGALISDIETANAGNHVAPQREQLRDAQGLTPVDVAVMTMSGNDVGFPELAKSCLAFPTPCDRRILSFYGLHSEASGDWAEGRVDNDKIFLNLKEALKSLHTTLNNEDPYRRRGGTVAPILVMAYPAIVPITGRSCPPMFDLLSPKEMDFLTAFVVRLNSRAEEAVLEARRDGLPVWFVPNTETAFLPEHTVCDGEPYARALNSFNGVPPATDVNSVIEDLTGLDGKELVDAVERGAVGDAAKAGAKAGKPTSRAVVLRLVKQILSGGVQELAHPNRDGYSAETRAILRWSTSPDARNAAEHLADYEPVDLLPTWTVSDEDLGQLKPGTAPQLQGGQAYPMTMEGLAPGTQLRVVIRSQPQLLATTHADGLGRAEALVAVPTTLAEGSHELEVTAIGAGGRPRIRRTAVTVEQDFHWTVTWTFPALLVAFGLSGLIAMGRRRLVLR